MTTSPFAILEYWILIEIRESRDVIPNICSVPQMHECSNAKIELNTNLIGRFLGLHELREHWLIPRINENSTVRPIRIVYINE